MSCTQLHPPFMLHEAYGVDDVISFAVTFHAGRAEGTQPQMGSSLC